MTEQILTPRRPGRQFAGPRSDTLADVLERVLDKGVVIVGDVVVSVLDVELLTLRLRLFIASADTAREMGLDWWLNDPFFSSRARGVDGGTDRDRGIESGEGRDRGLAGGVDEVAAENRRLRERVDALERALQTQPATAAAELAEPAAAGQPERADAARIAAPMSSPNGSPGPGGGARAEAGRP